MECTKRSQVIKVGAKALNSVWHGRVRSCAHQEATSRTQKCVRKTTDGVNRYALAQSA